MPASPPSLIEPLLRATCPERICQCGEPWAPVVSIPAGYPQGSYHDHTGDGVLYGLRQHGKGPLDLKHLGASGVKTLRGLAPTCACPDGTSWTPGVCLDPFSGAATTVLVARALGRTGVGVEASPAYLHLSRERLGLTDVHAWLYGEPARVEDYTDLPLFGI